LLVLQLGDKKSPAALPGLLPLSQVMLVVTSSSSPLLQLLVLLQWVACMPGNKTARLWSVSLLLPLLPSLPLPLSPHLLLQAVAEPRVKNTAFVFIKPHANTPAANQLVADGLRAKGVNIISEGTITAEEIDDKMLIDQHYYAIASKATILKPNQLNVPVEKFAKQFGLGWQEALDKGVVFNAKDACEQLGLDSDGLNSAWAACKKGGKLIKFGGGFYCGLIDTVAGKDPIYVFNGFFMSMRKAYVEPGCSIHYYSVEWDASKLSWEDFRGSVLGGTDPEEAPKDSLRGLILNDWRRLGLEARPELVTMVFTHLLVLSRD